MGDILGGDCDDRKLTYKRQRRYIFLKFKIIVLMVVINYLREALVNEALVSSGCLAEQSIFVSHRGMLVWSARIMKSPISFSLMSPSDKLPASISLHYIS